MEDENQGNRRKVWELRAGIGAQGNHDWPQISFRKNPPSRIFLLGPGMKGEGKGNRLTLKAILPLDLDRKVKVYKVHPLIPAGIQENIPR